MFHLKDTESRETAPFGNVLISVFIGVRFFFPIPHPFRDL